MPLFVFISGYFFRMKEGESLWRFAKRKFLRLMIPYYLWNFDLWVPCGISSKEWLSLRGTNNSGYSGPGTFLFRLSVYFEPCGLVCSFPFSHRACLQSSDLESVLEKGGKSMQIPFFPDPCGRNWRYLYVQKCRK